MKAKQAPKRRIKTNVWGNTYGYVGNRKVEDFGTDTYDAEAWLADPEKFKADQKSRIAFGIKLKDPNRFQ